MKTKELGVEGTKRNFGKRGRYKAICDECGEECFSQFSYTNGRPILCKKCFMKKNKTKKNENN